MRGTAPSRRMRGEWQRYVNDEGKEYFYNERNRTSVWELPEGLDLGGGDGEAGAGSSSQDAAAAAGGGSGWEEVVEDGTGKVFYHNKATGETSWTPPARAARAGGPGDADGQDWIGDDWTGVREALQTAGADQHEDLTRTAEKEKAEALRLAAEIEQVTPPAATRTGRRCEPVPLRARCR